MVSNKTDTKQDRQKGEQGSANSRDKPEELAPPQRDSFGRFLPGAPSVNPAGRPRKGQALTDILAEYLELSMAELQALDTANLPAKNALAVEQILAGQRGGLEPAASSARTGAGQSCLHV